MKKLVVESAKSALKETMIVSAVLVFILLILGVR